MTGVPEPTVTDPTPRIILTGHEKFTFPNPVPFGVIGPLLSALSLLVFAAASVLAIIHSVDWPWWAVAPFWCTAVGSAGGFLYEMWLILRWRPYQLLASRGGRFIQALRLGNLAPVFGSTYLTYCLLAYGTTGQAGLLTLIVGVITGFLLMLLLFRGPPLTVATTLVVGLVAQLIVVWTGPDVRGGREVLTLLTLAAVALYATTFIGAQTPQRSTIFHLVGAAVVGLLFLGLEREFTRASPSAHQVPGRIWLWLLAGIPLGALVAFRGYPGTWAVFRSGLANMIWPLFYLVIAGGPRVPRPNKLSDLYKGRDDLLKPLVLRPYYLAHPRNLTHPISVPSVGDELTVKVNAFGFLTGLVRFAFGLASVVNRFFPYANIDVPLAHKPRMEPWSDGTEYWPRWLVRRVYIPRLGCFQIEAGVRGPGFQSTPDMAIQAYSRGQLLAYLVEYGIAGALVEPVTRDGRPGLKLDLSFLEKYETKPDYEPYGGVAYFEVDRAKRCLVLTHVRAPRSDVELPADPTDARFRHAEDLVLASIYFYVVSGKHLVEIHMGLNLVEVALFNAFDAAHQWFHPVRLALYPHLFAHELAEELTTQNLLEDKAVFPQIFATTNAALVRHLNDRYGEYQLGRDEDFEGREAVMTTAAGGPLEEVLPRCCLVWEKEYAAVWHEYATALVAAAFADDAAVARDECVQRLYSHLTGSFRQALPARYDQLRTRAGLARFISDTIHHLVIRHEVYGTSGVRLALDPRINKVQVPKDGGTYAIDEWRSLACVAMATSRVRYTLLMSDFSNAFEDLKDPTVRSGYTAAYARLKSRLGEIEAKYRADGIDNYGTLRLLPSDLDIGAGY